MTPDPTSPEAVAAMLERWTMPIVCARCRYGALQHDAQGRCYDQRPAAGYSRPRGWLA